MVRPEDCFQLEHLLDTSEHDFGQIPANKNQRKIYGIIYNEQSGALNTLTLRQYASDGTTLDKEWAFKIGANDTIAFLQDTNSPIISIPGGKYLKALAGAASIQLILSVYDVE